MRSDFTLVLGDSRQLLSEWLKRLRAIRLVKPVCPVVTIVPNSTLAAMLRHQLLREPLIVNVRIITLQQLAWEAMPDGSSALPQATLQILADIVPERFLESFEPLSPNIRISLLQAAWELRRDRVTQTMLEHSAPWSPVMSWLDSVLNRLAIQTDHWDISSVYQYAARRMDDTNEEELVILLWGFSEARADEWELLRALVRLTPAVLTPWPALSTTNRLARRYLRPWVGKWRRLGYVITPLPLYAPEQQGHVERIPLKLESEQIHAVIAAVQYELQTRGPLDEVAIMGGDPALRHSLDKAGSRMDLHLKTVVNEEPSDSMWNIFLSVAEQRASRPETIRWLQHKGVNLPIELRTQLYRSSGGWRQQLRQHPVAHDALMWAENWGKALREANSWAVVCELVDAAYRQMPEDLSAPRVEEMHRWAIFDQVGVVPHPELVQQLLTGRLSEELPSSDDTADVVMVSRLKICWLDTSQRLSQSLYDRVQPMAKIRDRHRQQYRMAMLRSPVGDDLVWLVGPTWPEGWAPPRDMAAFAQYPDRYSGQGESAQWYHHWVDVPEYSGWSGEIGPQAGTLMSAVMSPSSLETFGTCPFRFFWQRLIGISGPGANENDIDISPAIRGHWAHRALELWARRGDTETPVATVGEMLRLVGQAIEQIPPPETVPSTLVDVAAATLASELAEAIWRLPESQRPIVQTWVEYEMGWQIDTGRSRWQLTGRVDRLDRDDGGNYRVIDYKTGEPPNPGKVQPSNLQLVLYHEAIANHFDVSPSRITGVMVGVSQKSAFHIRQLNDDVDSLYPQSHRILDGMAQRMQAGQFFPLPDAKRDVCRSCAVRAVCPADIRARAKRMGDYAPGYRSLWTSTMEGDSGDAD